MAKLSRREFFNRSVVSLGSILLAACDVQGSVQPTPAIRSQVIAASTSTTQPSPTQGQAKTPKPKGPNNPTQVGSEHKAKAITPSPGSFSGQPGFTQILGRPTADSIALSLRSPTAQQVYVAYGTQPGEYSVQGTPINLEPNTPQMLEMSGLHPNTGYFYAIFAKGVSTGEHQFHTQRSPGDSFTFTIDADPHNRDPKFSGELYATTLTNAISDRPDFHINLGDTFMTEKLKLQTYAEAESTFTDMRPYLGIIGADAPLFLVNGNHEGELGWLLKGKDKNLPIWSTQLRQKYYPNPMPGPFYSGSKAQDPALGAVRDSYYSWTWGDALFIVLDPFWYTAQKPQQEDLNNNWTWTLGKEQYDWLKRTLESSSSRFKFVFIHHLVGGNLDARGGIEFANLFEWGGNNKDGSYGFDQHRKAWGKPIHHLLVDHKVNAVFHGHDHVFVKQDLDGVVYQEMPQPSNPETNNAKLANDYGYTHGDAISSSGHLRVTINSDLVKVEYVRAYIQGDTQNSGKNGQVDYSYIIR